MKKFYKLMALLPAMWLAGSPCAWAEEEEEEPIVIPAPEQVDGVYQISNADELAWFADQVNNGETAINGALTADITLADNVLPMIGTDANKYVGVFDGQYHTVTFNVEATEAKTALFRKLSGTVRNLHTAGRISSAQAYACGIVAEMWGATVENCISSVTINIEVPNVDQCHAGVAGRASGAGNIIRNCVFDGKFTGEDPQSASGIVGWAPERTFIQNCLQLGTFEQEGAGRGCFTIAWGKDPMIIENCYYLNSFGYLNEGVSTQVTEEELADGSICYKLNGDQENIYWTQNLGEDAYPLPWNTAKQVYAQGGNLLCNGSFDPEHLPTFSNENTNPMTRDDHKFNGDGVCTECGFFDATAIPQLVDGCYEVFNITQWKWFASQVAAGNTEINVKLTADLNLGNELPMIGTEINPYAGTFDGQNYTLSFDVEATEARTAPFRHLSGTVRNLHTEGRISTAYSYACGICAIMYGCTIENCRSSVEIYNALGGQDYCHSGIAGRATGAGNTIRNCMFDGKLSGEEPISTSGIVGWAPNATLVENCLQVADIEMGGGGRGCFTIGWGAALTVTNTFYKNVFGQLNAGSQQISEEQLASGEICYALNGNQENTSWTQNLGEDLAPVNNTTRSTVYCLFSTYGNDGSQFYAQAIANELDFCQDMLTNMDMLVNYTNAVEDLAQYDNINDLLEAYEPLKEQRQALISCREAYMAYSQKIEETIAYLEEHSEMSGEKVDILSDYLTTSDEPDETFANGASQYILENRQLTEEEIVAETAKIDDMLQLAVIYSPTPGTDITMLLNNADFRSGFSGWEGVTGTATAETESMVGAECWAKTMDMYQTLTGLQNGVYELQVNGAYRPNEEYKGTNYAAFFYLNDIQNYFQADIEDIISMEEAQDGVNANITGATPDYLVEEIDGTQLGYIMHGPLGCCYAFQAGRYNNSVLVNVTDGTLKVGIKKLSTPSNSRDWLGFGNVKLIFRGTLEEAGDAMDAVLADMNARANVLLNVYESSSSEDYPLYPNFSQNLKDELKACMEAVGTTSDKYALIGKFSDLFQQVYDCKCAYIELADYLESLSSLREYDPSLGDEIDNVYSTTWVEWENGNFTKESAIEKKNEIQEWSTSKVVDQIPEPDLLDVVFNADGTATDKSVMENEIGTYGEPSVVWDSDLKTNVFDETAHLWAAKRDNSYTFDMTGDLWDKLSDGFSIESYVCPTWEGDEVPTEWSGIFGVAQSGGFLLGVSSQKWLFQASINGAWANGRGDTLIEKDRWVHLMGVWDKASGTVLMYVDGKLTGTASAAGELALPVVVDDTKCYIGADMAGVVSGTEPENSFQGKIAYVRIYDKAVPGAIASELSRRALATSIEEIPSEKSTAASNGIFNLMGQRVQKAQKGIYIVNGKKTIVK